MKYNAAPLLKIFLVFFLFSLSTKAQIIDTINLPKTNGSVTYSVGQLRTKDALKVDPFDHVWVGFHAIGAAEWDGSKWTMYDSLNNGLPTNDVLSLGFTANAKWIGTARGLVRMNGITTVYDSSNSGLSNNYVRCLFADSNNLWVGTNKGVFLFDGTSWTGYSTANSSIVGDTIKDIAKSGNEIWIGTTRGISKLKSNAFTNFTTANSGLYKNNIVKLVVDKAGTVWIQADSFEVYFNSSNTIVSAPEYFKSCNSMPSACCLAGTGSNGKILIGAVGRGCLITTDLLSEEIYYGNYTFANRSFFANQNPMSPNYYDTQSNGTAWMLLPFPITVNALFRLDYSSMSPALPNNNCYSLDKNQVFARLGNKGSLFYDSTTYAGKYEVPKGSGKNAIFMNGFWIGGIAPDSLLHLAAQTYRQSGDDFWPGPLDTTNATEDSLTKMRYDRMWKVDIDTINEFVKQYYLGNVTNLTYKIPDQISQWPAKESGNYSRNMAPFVDYNKDGNYNPFDGDYPFIKGDQMVWWVFNDNYSNHTETYSPFNLGVEIRAYAYAFNCPNASGNDSVINYTTFYHYDMINRSGTDYHDAYVGIFTDVDLGNYLDDFIGCDSVNDFGFVYNGVNDDFGIHGYGLNPPMLSVALLKGPQAETNDGLDNNHNAIVDEPGENCMMNHFLFYYNDPFGIPGTYPDYYKYMQSILKNGMHLTYGGNGQGSGNGATAIPTDYMFSGTPYDTSGWTETSAGDIPNDRRFLMSSGPFSLHPQQSKSLDYAIVFSRDKANPNGLNTSVAKNLADVMKVKQWFEKDSFPCVNSTIGIPEEENSNGLFIYPNPAQGKYSLVFKGASKGEMELMDITGRVVKQQTVFANQKNIIDVHDVAKGVYLVKVKDPQVTLTRKIVIE